MATILIVDDEEPMREALAMLFADAGHQTLTAMNGAQALEVAANTQVDLVISDVMMPVLNGIDMCERLERARSIPVILMSAGGRARADHGIADAFVDKPFQLEAIEEVVRQLLG
jgi:CheY-like chemotaxis protein